MIITTAMKAAEAILWKTLGENPLMKGKTRWGLTVRYRTLVSEKKKNVSIPRVEIGFLAAERG